jgi:5'-3' exoribonuclease 2
MTYSNHIHKSMLLRGVRLPNRALDQTDVDSTKARAMHTGRSHGGAPLRGSGGPRPRDSFNYASSNSYSRPAYPNQQSYGSQNGYDTNHHVPSSTSRWQPPPPGVAGFARGAPPPPPSSYGAYPQAPSGHTQVPGDNYGNGYQFQAPQQGFKGAYDNRYNNYGPPSDGPSAYRRY